MVNGWNQEVHIIHRPYKLDLRLHDLLCYALRFQLLGCLSIRIVSNRLVCGVTDDTDAHHSHHSYKQNSLYPEQAQCAACSYFGYNYDVRYVASAFRPGFITRVYRIADALLANFIIDSSLLHFSYSSRKNSFTAKELDLNTATSAHKSPNYHGHLFNWISNENFFKFGRGQIDALSFPQQRSFFILQRELQFIGKCAELESLCTHKQRKVHPKTLMIYFILYACYFFLIGAILWKGFFEDGGWYKRNKHNKKNTKGDNERDWMRDWTSSCLNYAVIIHSPLFLKSVCACFMVYSMKGFSLSSLLKY